MNSDVALVASSHIQELWNVLCKNSYQKCTLLIIMRKDQVSLLHKLFCLVSTV